MAKAAETQALPGYETVFITRNELSDEGLKTIQERMKTAVAEFGGEVLHGEDWGKRKLTYPIQKETRGQYTYFVYTGKNGVVHEVERNLRLSEHVLRFLTVNLATEFDFEVYKKARTEAQAASKKRAEEREARRQERMAERQGYQGYQERSYDSEKSYSDDSAGETA